MASRVGSFSRGLMAAGAAAWMRRRHGAQAMTFRLEAMRLGGPCGAHCPQVIVADGQISNSTPDEFLAIPA